MWLWHYGADTDLEVDHINRDITDNRIENLRLVTPREQNLNRRAWGRGYSRCGNRWMVCVSVNGRYIRRSCHTEMEAALLAEAIRRQR